MHLALRPESAPERKVRVGVDVFVDRPGATPDGLAAALQGCAVAGTKLTVISNRGTKVWPNGNPDTFWSDHWSCRFESDGEPFNTGHALRLFEAVSNAGYEVIKTEGLFDFDGNRGYSLAQGQ